MFLLLFFLCLNTMTNAINTNAPIIFFKFFFKCFFKCVFNGGQVRLCHKAEDTVIQLKTTSATKHKQDTTGTAKLDVGVGVGTTKAPSRGKSSEDDADGKFDNIFVRASRGASSKSFATTTLVEQVGAGGAKPAVGMRGTASTSTSVVVHIGGYTNPMVKEGDGHLGKGNKQEESKEKDHQKEKQEEKQKEKQTDDQKGEGAGREADLEADQEDATGEGVWASHIDSTSGETYYHRSLDGRTTW
jgi:hypothetical protein